MNTIDDVTMRLRLIEKEQRALNDVNKQKEPIRFWIDKICDTARKQCHRIFRRHARSKERVYKHFTNDDDLAMWVTTEEMVALLHQKNSAVASSGSTLVFSYDLTTHGRILVHEEEVEQSPHNHQD